MVPISAAAVSLIVAEEVSGRQTYERRYRHPEWPGGSSGVTIGIGCDVGAGYSKREKLHAVWDGKISDGMVRTLEPAVGVTGGSARALLASVQSVDVPWDVAMSVFSDTDMVEWYAICRRALPNFEDLPPDCRGSIVSLAYNRGASFSQSGDRYAEMRAIRAHMVARQFDKIPGEIRSMKRLWSNGLVGRREREALLFERGLDPAKRSAPVVTVNDSNRAVATKTAATTAAAGSAGSGGVATQPKTHGVETLVVGLALTVAISVAVYVYRSRHRQMPAADPGPKFIPPSIEIAGATP